MIKKYLTYIKESANQTISVDALINLHEFEPLGALEKELRKYFNGKMCVWYTKGNFNLQKKVVHDIKVMRNKGGVNVYFNEISVDTAYMVEIVENDEQKEIKHEITGFPSGEVLYVTRDELQFLLDSDIVEYKHHMKWEGKEIGQIFIFKDENYHTIKKALDPKYEKPVKTNIKKEESYGEGDVIICKGYSGLLNLHDRIGEILQVRKSPSGNNYLVSFFINFSEYLMGGARWWVKDENIKGIYIGDVEMQKTLGELEKDRSKEEHEIDDDYHIKQLFKKPTILPGSPSTGFLIPDKKSSEIKIGDSVVLSNSKNCLYDVFSKSFKDSRIKEGFVLGEVQQIEKIGGEMCVNVRNNTNWYKISCVEK